MFYKFYRFVRKNILLFGLTILLFSIFINLTLWLTTKNRIFNNLKSLPKTEVGLLLGTSKFNLSGNKNLFYTYRIDAAEKLLKSGKIKKIILSGSPKDGGYDEVKWMKNDLLKKGIDEKKIILDKKGYRTKASIQNILKKDYKNFTIISQKFHLERAVFLTLILDNRQVFGYEAKNPSFKYSFYIYFREFFSRLKLLLFDMFFDIL